MAVSRTTAKKHKNKKSREISIGKSRDIKNKKEKVKVAKGTGNISRSVGNLGSGEKLEKKKSETESATTSGNVGSGALERAAEICPYCSSKDFVRRGLRKNKHQEVQLYVCRNLECGRTFTSRTIKGRQFPWPVILDAVSYHNLGYTFPQVSKILEAKTGFAPAAETIASWYEEYKPLCRFERLRPYALKILASWRSQAVKRIERERGHARKAQAMSGSGAVKFDMVETTTLAHRQLYRFRYHRPKLLLTLEEYKNRNFGRLMDYLDAISTETPHQYFSEGARMSEIKSKFDKTDMIVRGKENFANKFAKFILQGVPNNKDRHEVLQRFMIANDSVTVATEVPVYIRKEDVAHFEQVLKFKVTSPGADVEDSDVERDTGTTGDKGSAGKSAVNVGSGADGYITLKGKKRPVPFPALLTGHIDIVQVRNGIVHILDYKPNADKEKPIEQLTWYALALSRLTGLRLFEFKCAWFDEHQYFEFYPLHVVKKLNRKRTKKIRYRDGRVAAIPKEDELHIIR
ncbi:hypothetical protein COU14_01050 [Candidatus Kaiserbacteria bacterium CG10_big_fil_rev_8_21_14_0_10_44_10]|uniref:PD-(D/E)XK endonuclease-like domain-containing protein n=1 Tax=Candidatus Kaiserbacteria bacterium CG10_big_fil_rev_8_21_14_0_10_44_10 TaxID=1974606 RepID=A0A2H0UJU8_9BACT|nr:MAG: hypothetical protein COU14_01050 [Candidatus Kaiserbacteria bacterium CG10_big_fil_rev_8_21_14_0_10_44_10]